MSIEQLRVMAGELSVLYQIAPIFTLAGLMMVMVAVVRSETLAS